MLTKLCFLTHYGNLYLSKRHTLYGIRQSFTRRSAIAEGLRDANNVSILHSFRDINIITMTVRHCL